MDDDQFGIGYLLVNGLGGRDRCSGIVFTYHDQSRNFDLGEAIEKIESSDRLNTAKITFLWCRQELFSDVSQHGRI